MKHRKFGMDEAPPSRRKGPTQDVKLGLAGGDRMREVAMHERAYSSPVVQGLLEGHLGLCLPPFSCLCPVKAYQSGLLWALSLPERSRPLLERDLEGLRNVPKQFVSRLVNAFCLWLRNETGRVEVAEACSDLLKWSLSISRTTGLPNFCRS